MSDESVLLNLLGSKTARPGDLVEITRKGIDYSTVKQVVDRYDLDLDYLSAILGTSKRTLARRAQRGETLSPVESDRLIRFLRIAAHAEEVFESREKAIAWLKADNRALGGQAPMDLLDTDAGTEQVDKVLTRIDYGVYS